MPSVLQSSLALLRAPAIEVSFAVRSALRWRRGNPKLHSSAGGATFAWADPERQPRLEARAAVLQDRYDLEHLSRTACPEVRCSNLARLEQLEILADGLDLPVSDDGVIRAADFGCGDFHYAVALQQWLSRHGIPAPSRDEGSQGDCASRSVSLCGIEMDGYGLYRDGHSRADHAQARAESACVAGSDVRFQVANAAAVQLPPQDVVSLFFPFLTPYVCLAWGAPLSRLRPRRLLQRAVESLRPGGWLVVANQTPREYLKFTRLMTGLPMVRIARCSFSSDLVPESDQTFGQVGSLWLRHEAVPIAASSG